MPRPPLVHATLTTSLAAALLLAASEARAEGWTLWAEGLAQGVGPSIAISDQREIFYTLLAPQMDGNGTVYRASLDDPQRVFTKMPSFPLPAPQGGASYNNVMALTTNARGEPVVGISINGNWTNTDPLLMTWDKDASKWIAAAIVPTDAVCTRNIVKLARAPKGDLWATCQWYGAYHSTDEGRTFAYVNVSKAVEAAVPTYFPTRANGASDLGALFALAIGPDGAVFVGTESGGTVYSTDDGATWRPLDADPTDPMSTMARATNMGNVAGVGVLPDGRVIVQGGDGNAPYPPPGTVGLYVFDLVAHTTTTATGFPDYLLAGLTTGQIVTLPSGAMFFNTAHDRVDEMTGAPSFGGIARSSDGLAWTLDNGGIDEIFQVPNMNLWIDGIGKADTHPFAVHGGDVYVVTKTGKIFVQSTGPGGGTDTDTDTNTDSEGASSGAAGSSGGSGSDASGPTTGSGPGGSTGADTSGSSAGSGGASEGAGGQDAGEGCACAADGRPGGALALAGLLAALGLRRRRP